MAAFNRCLDCRFAEWDRTAAGRLHPNKGGFCVWTKRVAFPASMSKRAVDHLEQTLRRHRWIDRGDPIPACDTFVKAQPDPSQEEG